MKTFGGDDLSKITQAAYKVGGRKVIFFGSRSRNDFKAGSDLDICVIVPKGENILDYQKNLRLQLWNLGYSWNVPLDLHVYPENIFEEGLVNQDPFITEIQRGNSINA